MDAPRLIRKLESAKCADWPGGNAWKLVESLIKKYKPSDVIAVAEQATKLMSLKLKRTEDPEDLGDTIPALKTDYGSPIDEKQKIAAIVKTAGHYYRDVIQNETARINATGGAVTAEDLIEAMSENWRIGGGTSTTSKEVDDSEPTDVALSDVPGAFANRKCFKFGEKGHMAQNCTKTGTSQNNGPCGGNCYECGKRRHRKDRCWELKQNAHLRPDGWKSVKGKEMTGVEVLVSHVEYPEDAELFLGSIDLEEEVTGNIHGTGNEMTAQRVGTSRKNVTEKGSGIGFKKKRTAQRVGTSQKNVTEKGCGLVLEEKVTVHSGVTGAEMTAKLGSGIEMINESEMTVQCGDGIRKNVYKTTERSGMDMTAKGSGTNEMKLYWESKSGFNDRGNTNSEQGRVLEVKNGARNVGLAKVLASCGNESVTEKDFKSCAMRILMRDENSSDARSEHSARVLCERSAK